MRLALAVLLTATLTGCADTANAAPQCATVWQEGATLSDPYTGCTQDGKTVKPAWHDCPAGSPAERYAEHDDGTAYATEGGPVVTTVGELATICD